MSSTIKFELSGALKILDEPSQAGSFMTLRYDDFTIRARGNDMVYKLPADKQISMRVDYVDAKGHPAAVESVSWTSSDELIVQVIPDGSDQQLVTIVPGNNLGQAQVVATADVDLGEGVKPLNTITDVEIVGGEAVAGTITPVGDPVPITQVKK